MKYQVRLGRTTYGEFERLDLAELFLYHFKKVSKYSGLKIVVIK